MFHKILVAFDLSEIGKHVFKEALSLAKTTNASLMLLHVLSPYEQGYPDISLLSAMACAPGIHEKIAKQYIERWEAFKEECLNLLRSRTDEATALGVRTEFTLIPGTPGHAICDLARTWGADLIVVGHQDCPSLKEAVLGSVSNYVTHHAPCSVLTLQHVFKG